MSIAESVPSPANEAGRLERVVFEIKRVIVGQDRLVERRLVGLLAKGHLLLGTAVPSLLWSSRLL